MKDPDLDAYAVSSEVSVTFKRCGTCKIQDPKLHAQIDKAAKILKSGKTRLTVASAWRFLKRPPWNYPLCCGSLKNHLRDCLGA